MHGMRQKLSKRQMEHDYQPELRLSWLMEKNDWVPPVHCTGSWHWQLDIVSDALWG
jgi:hypothetical protein